MNIQEWAILLFATFLPFIDCISYFLAVYQPLLNHSISKLYCQEKVCLKNHWLKQTITSSTLPSDRVNWSLKFITKATDLWERLLASQLFCCYFFLDCKHACFAKLLIQYRNSSGQPKAPLYLLRICLKQHPQTHKKSS